MFEGKYGTYWIADDILFVVYKAGLAVTLKVAREIVNDRLEVQKNVEYPVFCDITGIVSSNSEARHFLSQEGTLLIKALAIYATEPVSIRLTEFYLKTLSHKIPTKLFVNKNQSISFLKPYRK